MRLLFGYKGVERRMANRFNLLPREFTVLECVLGLFVHPNRKILSDGVLGLDTGFLLDDHRMLRMLSLGIVYVVYVMLRLDLRGYII